MDDFVEQLPSEKELSDTLWARVGHKTLAELPESLGFVPTIICAYNNCYKFVDSGVEVVMWINQVGKVAMISVKRLE